METQTDRLDYASKNYMYRDQIITREDLQTFRQILLTEIKGLLQPQATERKEWLKSSEVKKLLKISAGTLQNLRINGSLSYTKIGSIIFYSYQDIEKLLEQNKIDNSTSLVQLALPTDIDKRQTELPFLHKPKAKL